MPSLKWSNPILGLCVPVSKMAGETPYDGLWGWEKNNRNANETRQRKVGFRGR